MTQIIAALVFLFFSVSAFCNEGIAAFNRKDYNEAYRLLSQNPDKPESLYGIGRILMDGLGAAPRNAQKGLAQITRSAESGYRPAMLFLAEYYERAGSIDSSIRFYKMVSRGANQDIEKKILYLQAKLTKGDPTDSRAYCETLSKITESEQLTTDSALCSLRGHLSKLTQEDAKAIILSKAEERFANKEYEQAVRFWSAIPELPQSMYGLSKIFMEGGGSVKKDIQKSRDFLQRAADAGFPPANLSLAQFYESEGKIDDAITYYQKISSGKDKDIEKKIVRLLLLKNKGNEGILTKESCEIFVRAAAAGDVDAKVEKNICNYHGLLNQNSKNDSFQYLKNELIKNTNKYEKILISIGQELLDETGKNFDPELFEKVISQNKFAIEKAKVIDIIAAAKITFNKCAELPAYNQAQKKRFLTICSIAAYGGDSQASIALAEIFSSLSSTFASQDLVKAKYYLSQADQTKESPKLLIIKLNITSSEKDWKINLNQIEEFLQKYPNESDKLNPYFEAQIETLTNFKESGYTANSAQRLAAALLSAGDLELMKKAYQSLSQINSEPLNPLEDMDSNDRKKLREVVGQIRKQLDFFLARSKKNDSPPSEQQSQVSVQASANSTRETENTAQSSVSPNHSTASNGARYYDLSNDCDIGKAHACYKAAYLMLEKNPPSDFVTISLNERQKIARKILEKGVAKNDEMSIVLLYDLLINTAKTEEEKKFRTQLLDKLVGMDSAAGFLRKHALVIDPPTNIIDKVTSTVFKAHQVRASCDSVNALIKNSRLNSSDMDYAKQLFGNVKCRISENLR
jgi:TPR repeat protein